MSADLQPNEHLSGFSFFSCNTHFSAQSRLLHTRLYHDSARRLMWQFVVFFFSQCGATFHLLYIHRLTVQVNAEPSTMLSRNPSPKRERAWEQPSSWCVGGSKTSTWRRISLFFLSIINKWFFSHFTLRYANSIRRFDSQQNSLSLSLLRGWGVRLFERVSAPFLSFSLVQHTSLVWGWKMCGKFRGKSVHVSTKTNHQHSRAVLSRQDSSSSSRTLCVDSRSLRIRWDLSILR